MDNITDDFKNIIQTSHNEIYIISSEDLNYLYVNDGALNELGYSNSELLQMNVYDVNPDLTPALVRKLKYEEEIHSKVINRTIHKRKDGSCYHLQSVINKTIYKEQEVYVVFATNITSLVQAEKLLKMQKKELNYQANHDVLTKLPNRMLFQDRLSQTILTSIRNQEKFALLFIDLDQFKKINDSLGHHIGDEVLIEASIRLKSVLREEDTLARLGGDEFTIIIKDVKNIQGASIVAQKIINIMKESIRIKSHTLFISSSIGISMFPDDSKTEENLIKYADTAMYKAKDEGRDNFQFYSADMTNQAFERVILESSLLIAIKEEQFVVYYQPQINAKTNTITGMEALVRWIHPQIGMIEPAQFISIAEESGLIVDIDIIVMKQAMEQFALWHAQDLNPGLLSLNLAMKLLNKDEYISMLLNVMNSINFQAKWLEVEVTEGQIMQNPNRSIKKLEELSSLGIEIAIDDFGTGYSSLAYLKKLPLDKLKIDQSFIRDIPRDEDDVAITKAIIALGTSLNLSIIAEGVETLDQKEFLMQNNCHNIQGYFYAKPMPANEITELLKKGTQWI